jgi:DNA-binding transcriptional ArsR family regulator
MAYDHRPMAALADSTRRQIFELVAARPRSVADLTRALPVSQSAVSQHLKVLKDAELVRPQPVGTRTIYHVDPAGLGRMRAWLDRQWADALNAFKAETENKKGQKK